MEMFEGYFGGDISYDTTDTYVDSYNAYVYDVRYVESQSNGRGGLDENFLTGREGLTMYINDISMTLIRKAGFDLRKSEYAVYGTVEERLSGKHITVSKIVDLRDNTRYLDITY